MGYGKVYYHLNPGLASALATARSKRLQCRACRLAECLRAGMQKQAVRSLPVHKLRREMAEQRKTRESSRTGPTGVNSREVGGPHEEENSDADDVQIIGQNNDPSASQEGLVEPCNLLSSDKLAEASRAICTLRKGEEVYTNFYAKIARLQFKDGFLEQFSSLRELFGFNPDLTSNMEKFRANSGNSAANRSISYTLIRRIVATMELIRTMPMFALLEAKDQALLFNYVFFAVVEIDMQFRSMVAGSSTTLMSTGQSMHTIYHRHSRYSADSVVFHLADRLFRKGLEPFARVCPTFEEFLLLRAIVICHSATTGLSEFASALLQQEAERYSCVLMRLVQTQHGASTGALRYAELLHLAEFCFLSARKHRELTTYLAMVCDRELYCAQVPRIFHTAVLDGTEM